mmetsp:Transcript_26444/g.41158  ORF Transcript_26444/g.41158 Transcript_26444/m.41158 type:complete len:214 (-) Transcript_26444:47-688(-)
MDNEVLCLEENIRTLLKSDHVKEASVRHSFRLLDDQLWKLKESAYVTCISEDDQKAALSLVQKHNEERKRLKALHREVQRREEERKTTSRQELLGGGGEQDHKNNSKNNSELEKLRDEREKTRAKAESYRSMIRLLRREMHQGASAYDRLEQSSKQLNKTVDDQATLQDALKTSSAFLQKLKNKEYREKAYLYFSIFFFFFVVSLVWKQRILG